MLRQQRADHPSLQVAIRQPLIDYGTTVGLETLKQHVEQIVVPNVSKDVDIPVLGKVTVQVTDLKCVDFKEPRELTHIIIDDDSFHAKAKQVSAAFHFHWCVCPMLTLELMGVHFPQHNSTEFSCVQEMGDGAAANIWEWRCVVKRLPCGLVRCPPVGLSPWTDNLYRCRLCV